MAQARVNKPKVKRLFSAGGVVYKMRDGVTEVVLCGMKEPVLLCLPKGTPEKGESVEQTALREVREETGLEVEVEAPLGSIDYWFVSPEDKARCFKTVYFYLMTSKGDDTRQHDFEFDTVQWFPIDEALQRATYTNEVDILGRARSLVMEKLGKDHGNAEGI